MDETQDLPECLLWSYAAFISYSHKDEAVARRLQRRLEDIRLPAQFVRGGKRHLRPVFRDRTDLPAGPSLDEALKQELEQSCFLIVICSPAAARSPHVNREIETFQKLGRGDRILTILASGKAQPMTEDCPEGAFPPALLMSPLRDPLAADLTAKGNSLTTEAIRLASHMLKVQFDELYARHRRRQIRNWIVGAASAAAIVALATGGGLHLSREAAGNKARQLAANALEAYAADELVPALQLARQSLETRDTAEGRLAAQKIILEAARLPKARIIAQRQQKEQVEKLHLVPDAEHVALLHADYEADTYEVQVLDYSGVLLDRIALQQDKATLVEGLAYYFGASSPEVQRMTGAQVPAFAGHYEPLKDPVVIDGFAVWIESEGSVEVYRPGAKSGVSHLKVVDLRTGDVFESPSEDLYPFHVIGGAKVGDNLVVGVRTAENDTALLFVRLEGAVATITRRANFRNVKKAQFLGVIPVAGNAFVMVSRTGLFLAHIEETNRNADLIPIGMRDAYITVRDALPLPESGKIRILFDRNHIVEGDTTIQTVKLFEFALQEVVELSGFAGRRPHWIGKDQLAVAVDARTEILSLQAGRLKRDRVIPAGGLPVCGEPEPRANAVPIFWGGSVETLASLLSRLGTSCMPGAWADALQKVARGPGALDETYAVRAASTSPDGTEIALRWAPWGDGHKGLVSVHDRSTGALRRVVRFTAPPGLDLGFPLLGAADGGLYVTTDGHYKDGKATAVLLRLPDADNGAVEQIVGSLGLTASTGEFDGRLSLVAGRYLTRDYNAGVVLTDPQSLKSHREPTANLESCAASLGRPEERVMSADGDALQLSGYKDGCELKLDGLVDFRPTRVAPQPGGSAVAVLGQRNDRSVITVIDLQVPAPAELLDRLSALLLAHDPDASAMKDALR